MTAPVTAPGAGEDAAPSPNGGTTTRDGLSRRMASASARRGGRKAPRTVRVTRAVVRHLDPWSVGKVSLLFYLSAYVVVLTALVLLWGAAASAGVIDNVEGFMDSLGFTNFRFLPGRLLQGTVVGGLVLAVAGAVANVVMAVLYNLISDVVGGVRITLADDEPRSGGVK